MLTFPAESGVAATLDANCIPGFAFLSYEQSRLALSEDAFDLVTVAASRAGV